MARITGASIILLSLAGMLGAGQIGRWIAPGFDVKSLSLLSQALVLCWVFFLFASLSFLPRLFLNSRQVFWPGASTSLVISSFLVVGSLVVAKTVGSHYSLALSIAAIFAGIVILVIHLYRDPVSLGYFWSVIKGPAKSVTDYAPPILGPIMLVLVVHFINAMPRFVDRSFASGFPQGIVAALEYSYNIITVPGILLGSTLVIVLYPGFVRRVQDANQTDLHKTVVGPALIAISAAAIAGVGLHFMAEPVIDLVYGRGAFGAAAVASTSTLLSWHALGLGFMVATLILLQACLAYGAFLALFGIAIIRLIAKVVATAWLVPHYQLDGLGASFIVPEVMSAILLLLLLLRLSRNKV